MGIRWSKQSEPCQETGTFYYFAFGSNLLQQRITLRNPTAKYVAVGCLDGFRFEYAGHSDTWMGATATITRTDDSSTTSASSAVWGVIWEISWTDSKHLDRQEGRYERIQVPVKQFSSDDALSPPLQCRTYVMRTENRGAGTRPSPQYKWVVEKGASESALPADYQSFLRSFPHNDYTGAVKLSIPYLDDNFRFVPNENNTG